MDIDQILSDIAKQREDSIRIFNGQVSMRRRDMEKDLAAHDAGGGRYGPAQGWRRSDILNALDALPKSLELKSVDIENLTTAISEVDLVINKYETTLSIRRRQTEFVDDYGAINDRKWRDEISRFVNSNPEVAALLARLEELMHRTGARIDWRGEVAKRISTRVIPAKAVTNVKPSDGIGFETACIAVLVASGWQAHPTPATGDQGVDILARRGTFYVAIQCKNLSSSVGNKAIQEVHAGAAFCGAEHAVVVSRSGYTRGANQLAQSLNVLNIDYAQLETLHDLLGEA